MIVGTFFIRYDRFLHVDFLHPFLIEPVVLLMPPPVSSINLMAIWNPFDLDVYNYCFHLPNKITQHLFSFKVWILLLGCTLVMGAVFLILGRFKSGNEKEDTIRTREDVHSLFIIGNLLARGFKNDFYRN